MARFNRPGAPSVVSPAWTPLSVNSPRGRPPTTGPALPVRRSRRSRPRSDHVWRVMALPTCWHALTRGWATAAVLSCSIWLVVPIAAPPFPLMPETPPGHQGGRPRKGVSPAIILELAPGNLNSSAPAGRNRAGRPTPRLGQIRGAGAWATKSISEMVLSVLQAPGTLLATSLSLPESRTPALTTHPRHPRRAPNC